ncbi:FAD-dependent oxidoreductase [Holdemania massiliensis]|uniref:FAD-dependent oxidoreductase n=1 Tax=Holdemania massiliensis TaxID=1468449 RepID=UPI0026759726|nr:FAD-dependent oxidoreductase [Holdemania massiliensis]
MTKISRRSFLKGSASLAVLGVLGGCAQQNDSGKTPENTPAAPKYNATSKTGLCPLDFSKMEKLTTDVAVIGGGGAGICAAIAAAQNGAQVLLMEKLGMLGGATILSGGKIPATGTEEQLAYGVTDDTVEANARDILRPNNYSVREELVYTVCENAKDMIEWTREMGVKWTIMDSLYYGQSEYRMHNAEGNGAGMTQAMIDTLNATEAITTLLEFSVEGLTLEGDVVTGCYGKDKAGKEFVIEAKNVVLASSGFGNNDEMLAQYCPETLPAVKIVASGATGEGILWGEQLGAKLACMGAYQGYAFHNVDNDTTSDQGLANNGGIFINEQGHRFCNEYGGYSELTPHILAQSHNLCYLCFTDIQKEKCANFAKWDEEGIVFKAETIDDLAAAIGVDPAVMNKTVSQYQAGIEKGEDLYNRTKLPANFDGPYYAIKITGEIRHTQGGIATDVDAHALREDGSVIQGLYAAGGCTEGFSSGDGAAYMSGNGLLQAMIFGKIAGIKAATEQRGEIKAVQWSKA